jgi:26S proteasome regulatory subunit N2
MEAVLDTGFSLSYRDQVLHFLFPLFPQPTTGDGSPHVHALTRLLVTLSSPALTVPLLTSLIPKEKLLAYQFAFDLVEGGAQDFLESVRNDLPEGEEASVVLLDHHCFLDRLCISCTQDTKETYDKLRNILTGQESVKLYLEFLKRNNQVDLLVLKHTKVG